MKTQRIGFLTLLMLTLASTAIYLLNQNRVTASVEDTSIAISGFAFSPETVNVTVGEAVTWTNEDSATHTVTGADFDSSELANGENFSVTFTQVGSYSYVCSIHSSMTGLINVGLAFNNSVYLPTILGPAGSDGQTPVSAPPTGQDALTVNSGNWANPATWQNGRTPQAGDTIIIQDRHTILLDQDSPQLGGLMIVGTLIFDQKDLALTSNWIMVHGPNALLEIGTETVPYEHKATITLTATDPDENISGEGAQASGTNFLMAMEGGTIDIHGSSRDKVNWTQLAETANPGDTQLVLADAVNWEVGDEIAIAPSGYDPYAGERVTITAVDGTTVSITPPLNNPHVAIIETHGGKTLDMRAEVGLLTRNIVIQAPEDALDNQFGGHIMIMETAMARVEGVELVRMGQMRKKGRYPFHWHLAGDVSGHYLKNSSIHTSQHRAVAVHGSHGALVEGVVAYDIWSHAMIPAEDGNEYNNTFKDNLVIQVKNLWDTPEGGDNFAFGTGNNSRIDKASTQNEGRAGGFWYMNPHNTIVGNHVAGVENGMGFFLDVPRKNFDGRTGPIAPAVFDDNSAHSITGVTGTGQYIGRARGMGVFAHADKYSDKSEIPYPEGHAIVSFDHVTTYKVDSQFAMWLEEGHTLNEAIVADYMRIGFAPRGDASVTNSIFVGSTSNIIEEDTVDQYKKAESFLRLITQFTKNNGAYKNITAVNLQSAIELWDKYGRSAGYSTFEGISLINTPEALKMLANNGEGEGYILDVDGSLTGTPNTQISLKDGSGKTAPPPPMPTSVLFGTAASEEAGNYLTADTLSVYTFDTDSPNQSSCDADCAGVWPPVMLQDGLTLEAPADILSLLGTFTRDDGTVQVSFDGRPLYFYIDDEVPGDTIGHGNGDVWHLVILDSER